MNNKIYKQDVNDDFPDDMTIILGDQKLNYKKKKWDFKDDHRGLRYGDNPGQSAALYELTEGNLKLGDVTYLGSGESLVSNVNGDQLKNCQKNLSKSNITDVDAALNIFKIF